MEVSPAGRPAPNQIDVSQPVMLSDPKPGRTPYRAVLALVTFTVVAVLALELALQRQMAAETAALRQTEAQLRHAYRITGLARPEAAQLRPNVAAELRRQVEISHRALLDTQAWLTDRAATRGPLAIASGALNDQRAAHRQTGPILTQFLAAIDDTMDADSAGAEAAALRAARYANSALFPHLTRISFAYRDNISTLNRLQAAILLGLLALLLAGVLGETFFLLRPSMRRNAEQADRLAEVESTLTTLAETDPVTGFLNPAAVLAHADKLPREAEALAIAFELCPTARLPHASEASINLALLTTTGERFGLVGMGSVGADPDPLVMPDLVGRLDGGGFCLVYAEAPGEAAERRILREIQALAEEPLVVSHMRLRLECKIGIARRRPRRGRAQMVRDAAHALDKARISSANAPVPYTPFLRREANKRRHLASQLRVGLMGGEVIAHFQPQLDLRCDVPTGFEALARWQHPRRGLLPAGAFLQLALDVGLDEPLGEVMLRQALEALRAWDLAGHSVGTVGVNLTRSQLTDPKLPDLLRWELDRFNIAPARLAIEVLENVHVASEDDPVVRNLAIISGHGIRIELDDYGTGTASITGIRRLNTDRLKIDRSYIQDIDKTPANRSLVTAIVNMARDLGIESLAEGVETAEELAALRRIGCGYVQGYHVAKPMSFDASLAWLDKQGRAGASATG